MNSKELLEELASLKLKEKYLKRKLDIAEFDKDIRGKTFIEIKEVRKQINNIKFKLRLCKEMLKK